MTIKEKIIALLKQTKKPLSCHQMAKILGLTYRRVNAAINHERSRSGTNVFRVGGVIPGVRKSAGYVLGPGDDFKGFIRYGELHRQWTQAEEDTIRVHVGNVTVNQLSEMLKRDTRVLRRKLRDMGYERGATENVLPKGFDDIGVMPLDTIQKQWRGGHIFRLKSDKPGITGVLIHNTARRGEGRELHI